MKLGIQLFALTYSEGEILGYETLATPINQD